MSYQQYREHVKQASEIIASALPNDTTPGDYSTGNLLALAQIPATMALAEAVLHAGGGHCQHCCQS